MEPKFNINDLKTIDSFLETHAYLTMTGNPGKQDQIIFFALNNKYPDKS